MCPPISRKRTRWRFSNLKNDFQSVNRSAELVLCAVEREGRAADGFDGREARGPGGVAPRAGLEAIRFFDIDDDELGAAHVERTRRR